MWAPGAYLPNRDEGDLDHANIGVEKYFFAAGDKILNRIKEVRNTAILPERTGPIADVLYSAAGNSADEHWYERDVIAYSFETGADLFFVNTQTNTAAGASAIRISPNAGGIFYLKPGDTLRVGADGPNEETRIVASVDRTANPNVLFTQPLANAHPANTRVEGAALQTGVGFQPAFEEGGGGARVRGRQLWPARVGARVREGPQGAAGPDDRRARSTTAIDTTFVFGEEPAVIRYTTDGSTPTESSTAWDSTGPREPGVVFHVTETTTFRWRATDIKGNTSFGQRTFTIVGG